jgi:phosphotriesterase-related protein
MPAGMVQTVLGPVRPDELGLTLPHEHLFVRIEGWAIAPESDEAAHLVDAPMSLAILSRVRRRALTSRDNCRVDDPDVVTGEVGGFIDAGGGAIVDLTPPDLGRAPQRMLDVSRNTGVHVICGCGYYVDASHPPEVTTMSVQAISELLEQELVEGIAGTEVRPGVIGEIGTGNPVTENETKVLLAAAAAQRRTGCPISIHLFPAGGTARQVADIMDEAGADLGKVTLCHLDGQDPIDVDEHIELAARGVYVEYDVFGANWTSDDVRQLYADRMYWSPPPSDQQRVRAVRELFAAGMGEQVLISHDICTKFQQVVWGGPGCVHIPKDMLPFFRANGLLEVQVDMLTRHNPQRWLTWTEPKDR